MSWLVGLEFNGSVNTIIVSVPNHTFPRQAWYFKRLTGTCAHSFAKMHICSPGPVVAELLTFPSRKHAYIILTPLNPTFI